MTATAQWELGLPIHHWLDHWLAQDIATTQRPCAAREGTPIRPRAHAAGGGRGGGAGNPRSDFPCTGDPFLTESPLRRSLPPTWRSSGAHMAIGHLNRRRHQTAPPKVRPVWRRFSRAPSLPRVPRSTPAGRLGGAASSSSTTTTRLPLVYTRRCCGNLLNSPSGLE